MLMCNCTLGIDNPEACKKCSAYINYYRTEMPQYIYEVYDFNLGNWYNPETHDLVEKKDAKIIRLRKEVEELQRLLDFESKVIDERISSLADRKLELDKLKDELSKAEQE